MTAVVLMATRDRFLVGSGRPSMLMFVDDDVYYYIVLETKARRGDVQETENMGVCTKEWERHDRLCWKCAAVWWSGADGRRC